MNSRKREDNGSRMRKN